MTARFAATDIPMGVHAPWNVLTNTPPRSMPLTKRSPVRPSWSSFPQPSFPPSIFRLSQWLGQRTLARYSINKRDRGGKSTRPSLSYRAGWGFVPRKRGDGRFLCQLLCGRQQKIPFGGFIQMIPPRSFTVGVISRSGNFGRLHAHEKNCQRIALPSRQVRCELAFRGQRMHSTRGGPAGEQQATVGPASGLSRSSPPRFQVSGHGRTARIMSKFISCTNSSIRRGT